MIENTEILDAQEIAEKPVLVAGSGRRFANLLLDTVFFYIICIILGIVIAVISPSSLSFLDEDNSLVNYLLGFLLSMTYYTIFEYNTGRTIAKFITKTKTVTEAGEKPELNTILVRSLCRFIPFDALSFLGNGVGWHDTISKTRVVLV